MYSQKNGKQVSNKDTYTDVHSSTIHNRGGIEPKCLSPDKWINKMWYIHAMEYYSAIKRNKVLINATTWVNPDNIMFSERNQTQKITYCNIIPLL